MERGLGNGKQGKHVLDVDGHGARCDAVAAGYGSRDFNVRGFADACTN